MKALTSLFLLIIFSGMGFGQEEVKLKFGGIDRMVIKRNTNGDLQLDYPNNSPDNLFIGAEVGNLNKGNRNVGLGSFVLSSNVSGFSNVAIGYRAGLLSTVGNKNVYIGADAGFFNLGNENVFLGSGAGGESNGSGNIFIGNNAGYFEPGSNKLIIDNGLNGIPFIYGEMDNEILNVNGNMNVRDTMIGNTIKVFSPEIPSLIFERPAPSYLSWKISMENTGLKFYNNFENGTLLEQVTITNFGDFIVGGQILAKNNIFIDPNSGSGRLYFSNNPAPGYELCSNNEGFRIRGGNPLITRLSMTNDDETFLFDEVTIENDLIISNTFESKILFERTNAGAHDWEVLAKSGDLFFRGGADGSGADLFNKVVMRNNGDLEVCGKISASSATVSTFSCTSDRRYKKNILPLKNVLSNVLLLQGVAYDWKMEEFPDKGFNEDPQIGFIAQEVEEVFPEVVKTDEEGYKSIDYARLTPLLVESIKEQQQTIVEMKKMLEELSKKVESLERKEAITLNH